MGQSHRQVFAECTRDEVHGIGIGNVQGVSLGKPSFHPSQGGSGWGIKVELSHVAMLGAKEKGGPEGPPEKDKMSWVQDAPKKRPIPIAG